MHTYINYPRQNNILLNRFLNYNLIIKIKNNLFEMKKMFMNNKVLSLLGLVGAAILFKYLYNNRK